MPATLADYRAAVDRFTTAIDRVLAEGLAAQSRYDQFCQRQSLTPETLARIGENLPSVFRQRHDAILPLWEKLYAEHAATAVPLSASPQTTSQLRVAAVARALSHRSRL